MAIWTEVCFYHGALRSTVTKGEGACCVLPEHVCRLFTRQPTYTCVSILTRPCLSLHRTRQPLSVLLSCDLTQPHMWSGVYGGRDQPPVSVDAVHQRGRPPEPHIHILAAAPLSWAFKRPPSSLSCQHPESFIINLTASGRPPGRSKAGTRGERSGAGPREQNHKE